MKRLVSLVAILAAISACADTTAPAPPATEVLLVVNSTEVSLSVVPVDDPTAAIKIPLGGVSATPVNVSALNGVAIVPMGLDNAVAVVDLITGTVARTIPLEANSGATDSAIVDVGVYPQGVVYTRGRIFVINGNLVNFAVAGESWITVIDPTTNARATGIDSIPLPGPGNAGLGATVSPDGLIYVMNTGGYAG